MRARPCSGPTSRYLAAIKQQNGAAMSAGRLSTFWDIYFERDLREGTLTETAGPGDSSTTWSSSGGSCASCAPRNTTSCSPATRCGSPRWWAAWARTAARWSPSRPSACCTRSTTSGRRRSPTSRCSGRRACPRASSASPSRSSIDTSSIQYESDDLMRPKWGDDCAIACCVSAMRVGKQMQFFGARVNLPKTLLYALNGGRDEVSGEQVGPMLAPITGDLLDYDEVMKRLDPMLDWLAKTYVNALNCHPLHARQVLLRGDRDGAARSRRAAHAGLRHRGPVARHGQPVGDHATRKVQAGARRARAHRRLPDRPASFRASATTTTAPTASRPSWCRR